MENKMLKSDNILIGLAGKYFVVAELYKRGFIASIDLRNTGAADISVANRDKSKSVLIQVRTTKSNVRHWVLNEKAENYCADNSFYVFVNLRGKNQRPDFFVVPSKIVANYIKKSHKHWLKSPSVSDKKHNDSTLRKFSDINGTYLERWAMLGL